MPYMRDSNSRRLDSISVPSALEALGRPAGRVVSTRSNRLVNGRLTNTNGDGRTYKVKHFFPRACGHLTLWYANIYAGGWGETPNTNALIVRAALVKSDGTVFAATFNNGAQSLYLPGSGQLATPSAPTLAAGTAGALTASGAYWVALTYVNQVGETVASTATQVTVGASTPSITVTAPAPVAGATGYRVYCGLAGGANTGPFYLVGAHGFGTNPAIANNPTAALPLPPSANTTGASTGANAGTPPLLACTDPLPADITAGDYAYSVTYVNTPVAGQLIPVGTATWGGTLATGEGNTGSDVVSSHTSVGTNNTTAYSPYFITGLSDDPSKPSIAIIGDSIPEGTGDPLLGPNDPGYVITGLNNNYPYAWLAKGSELTTDFMNQTSTAKQRRVVRMLAASHCTVSLGNYGTNDVGAASSTATIKANLLTIWSALKRRGQRVYWSPMTPRTKSLDGWRTAGPGNGTTTGQWFYENAAWGANGGTLALQETVRQQVNQWLRAPRTAGAGNSALLDAAGALDGIVDVGLTVEANSDGTAIAINPATGAVTGLGGGYWKPGDSTGTTSGTATAGSTSTVTDSGQAWTVNQFTGYMVLITSGTGAGQVAQVASNTATVLTLWVNFTATAGTGSGYVLFKGYTQDGIHPTKPSHTLMAATVATWAAGL